MTDPGDSFFFLPGAGNRGLGKTFNFQVVHYPGWQRYVVEGFSAEQLLEELTAQIASSVPHGPIRIAGASLGGHFAYAIALRLQQMDREVAGIVALDTFMIDSSGPSEGWQSRALGMALDLLRKLELNKIVYFVRSRFWRAIYRFAGARLTSMLRAAAPSGRLPWFLAIDPVAEDELSMRLLLRAIAPWVAALDHNPTALNTQAVLLRTSATAKDDSVWLLRCPEMNIVEIPGEHATLFEPENINALHDSFQRAISEWQPSYASPEMTVSHS